MEVRPLRCDVDVDADVDVNGDAAKGDEHDDDLRQLISLCPVGILGELVLWKHLFLSPCSCPVLFPYY